MGELEGIYTIWLRENKRYIRYRSRIITSVVTPLLWLIIFGTGLGSAIRFGGISGGYTAFIFPGIIGMTILFTAIFSGVSVIMDRQYGFLKEIMVAPISRESIVFGKALGVGTTAMIQGALILLLSFVIGVHMTIPIFIASLVIMVIMALGLVGIGLLLAAFTESMEGFNLIMSFVVMPMFFLSGALFPISTLPVWLKTVVFFDPMTYGVDALRNVILGQSIMPLYMSLAVIIVFAIALVLISAFVFSKREQSLM